MKQPSFRQAINNMCKECIYDGSSGSGTWKEQVKACTSKDCALFNLRPLPQGSKHEWQEANSLKYKEDVANGVRKPAHMDNSL